MAEDLTLEFEATPKWWFHPACSLALLFGKLGLLRGRTADRVARFIGNRGHSYRVVR